MDSEPELPGDQRRVIGIAEKLKPGQRKIVEVSGRQIGVFNIDGNYHALRNLCPHKSGPLCLGRIRPYVRAEGFEIVYEPGNTILKCPGISGSLISGPGDRLWIRR